MSIWIKWKIRITRDYILFWNTKFELYLEQTRAHVCRKKLERRETNYEQMHSSDLWRFICRGAKQKLTLRRLQRTAHKKKTKNNFTVYRSPTVRHNRVPVITSPTLNAGAIIVKHFPCERLTQCIILAIMLKRSYYSSA